MPDQPADMLELAAKLRYDLTAAQAKLTELKRALAALNPPASNPHRCDRCGISKPTERLLAEHAYHTHNGPVPDHWNDDGEGES